MEATDHTLREVLITCDGFGKEAKQRALAELLRRVRVPTDWTPTATRPPTANDTDADGRVWWWSGRKQECAQPGYFIQAAPHAFWARTNLTCPHAKS